MKYLDVDGIGKVSRIGVGTWQFGSREWGYGDNYAAGGATIVPGPGFPPTPPTQFAPSL